MKLKPILLLIAISSACGSPEDHEVDRGDIVITGQRYGNGCLYPDGVELTRYPDPGYENNGALCFGSVDEGIIFWGPKLTDDLKERGYTSCTPEQHDAYVGPDCPTDEQVAVLPASFVYECLEEPETPNFCTWVAALDGLYYGTITSLSMVSSPAVSADGAPTLLDSCEGVANQALEIELDVERSLVGMAEGTVHVRLGIHQLDQLDPRPLFNPRDGLTWGAGARGLEVGDVVGIPVHRGPDGTLGLLGEPMFTMSSDGSLIFQERDNCSEPVSTNAETLAALESEIGACGDSADGEARREFFSQRWSDRAWTDAAVCFD